MKKPQIFIRHCSHCETDFGCIINGIQLTCAECSTTYGSAECILSIFENISHGFCSEECCFAQYPSLANDEQFKQTLARIK